MSMNTHPICSQSLHPQAAIATLTLRLVTSMGGNSYTHPQPELLVIPQAQDDTESLWRWKPSRQHLFTHCQWHLVYAWQNQITASSCWQLMLLMLCFDTTRGLMPPCDLVINACLHRVYQWCPSRLGCQHLSFNNRIVLELSFGSELMSALCTVSICTTNL